MHKKPLSCLGDTPSDKFSSPCQEKEATRKHGFTLVELIVVITILAILGTIAFISLQGYSKDARDSTRISDLSAMKTSLELFQLDAGKYPDPTDGFVVSYSGSEVWTQGTFGTATFSNVSKLDKIPTDPLTDKEYTYSVTKTKQEYQFAGIVEGDEITLNSAISQTNAGDLIATALVTGTYNGQIIKTESGTNCNILSLPSIISSAPNTTTDLTVILNNESLVYNGYKNLPTNYISSKYKTDGGFEFTSKKVIVYDDLVSCAPLYNPEDNTARVELITNLQEAYSGTLIENEDSITGVVNIDLTDTSKLDIISSTLINNDLGGDLVVASGGGVEVSTNSCDNTTKPTDNGYIIYTIGTPISVNQEYIKGAVNCGYTCTNGYTGVNCEIAAVLDWTLIDTNCTIPNIHIPAGCVEGTIGCQIWAGCNSTLGTGIEYSVNQNCYDYVGGDSTGCNRPSNEKENVYNPTYGVNNIWGKLYTWANSGTACVQGYHVPTEANLTMLENNLAGFTCRTSSTWQCDGLGWAGHESKTDTNNIINALKLPLTGFRHADGASLYRRGFSTTLWASDAYSTDDARGRYLERSTSGVSSGHRDKLAGFSVRCLKN